MIELADVYIALPGGPGTLDELSDIISLQRLHINENPCILYDIDGFYQPLKAFFEEMQTSGFQRTYRKLRHLFRVVERRLWKVRAEVSNIKYRQKRKLIEKNS